MRTPKILISDNHIGTSLWQQALLESAGWPTDVVTLSAHVHYARSPHFSTHPLMSGLDEMATEEVRRQFSAIDAYQEVTHALCSFPPSRCMALTKLPEHIRIIVNIGHRFHLQLRAGRWQVEADNLIALTEQFMAMSRDRRFMLACMSQYDLHYTRYYTGVDNVPYLPVVCAHLPKALRENRGGPVNRTVLIGPSHNLNAIFGFASLDELNAISRRYAARHSLAPYAFDFVKSIYPNDTATPERLAQHPAVLINPYSAFSISMAELYQLNIPCFIASDALLVDRMQDVRLLPYYSNSASLAVLEQAYPVQSNRFGYPYSPNDTSAAAQMHWLQYMFFNQVGHVQRWHDAEDLMRRLYGCDLSVISAAMQRENEQLFDSQPASWNHFLKESAT